jgi:signal transduction histidine kinase
VRKSFEFLEPLIDDKALSVDTLGDAEVSVDYRIDPSRSSSTDNHGLGLAIVKVVAKTHGGSVFAHSSGGVNAIGLTLPAPMNMGKTIV